jgi:AraC family transcriptional regulator, ethanolamine operon transcriptional activator
LQRDSHITADPPAVTVTRITEPTAINAGIELIDQEAVQLQPLPLRALQVMVRLESASVLFSSTNRRLRTTTSVHQGLIGYVAFGPHSQGTVNGTPVRPGLMLAAQPETEARFVVEPGWESVAFLVPAEDLRAHLAVRRREHEFHVPRGIETLHADPDGPRRLFNWGRRLTSTAAGHPVIFNEGKNERVAAQVELLETLLRVLRAAEQPKRTRGDQTRQGHSEIVRIAESHAVSRVQEHVSVSDLCKAAGVSERTLEYAFRKVMGLTPVAYLTRLRLHRVRQGLLDATRRSTTVSAEALNWGFWHFGEFSRAYRDCFGELPSETLRRARNSTR